MRDDGYRPTSSAVTIPGSEGVLAGTYTSLYAYNVDGGLRAKRLATVPGLGGETLTFGYDPLGLPVTLSGNGSYVSATVRSPYGQVLQYDLGNTVGKASWQTFFYEDGTRRLSRRLLDRQNVATTDVDVAYAWDPAGNLTRVGNTPQGAGADVQCFGYDYLRRLTQAWTATDGCAGGPSLGVLGANAPYWTSYGYDVVGNRSTETGHAAGGDTVRSYARPGAGQARPHAVTAVTTTGPGTAATTDSFGYDAAGNTTWRAVTGGPAQTLSWDGEGRLGSVTAAGAATSFLYDAAGSRLIRREPGATTLYLDGAELRLDTSTGTVTSTRYWGCQVVCVSSQGLSLKEIDCEHDRQARRDRGRA